uniref:DDE Tnp4 domain-containing protein n=1 Tax=Homalodisca liturata TaxID=320908 RepID=A0A1B6HZT2_9HEMI
MYLATGNSFVDLHHSYRLGATTIKEIVARVCSALWNVLKNECLPEPSKDDWLRIASEFENRANFPNCLGAVDGKHIRIVKPPNSASLYFNYKHYFSIVLMAVTDADYKFVFIDVGSYGKCGDYTIFQQSALHQRILADTIDLPEDRAISSSSSTPIPFVFLADDAFSLSHRVLCPFIGKQLNDTKRTFNYPHCRARRYVECTFGILANKWEIFHRPLNVDVDLAIDIVKACCILHNYVRSRDGLQFVDTLYKFPTDNDDSESTHRNRQYNSNTRNILAEYFVNEGAVPWQKNYL